MASKFYSTKLFERLWIHQKGLCFYCQQQLCRRPYDRKKAKNGYTRDHFFPRVAGHTLEGNSVLSCQTCNGSKGHTPPTFHECLEFVKLWHRVKYKKVSISPVWEEFIEDLRFIREFSRLVGMPCP